MRRLVRGLPEPVSLLPVFLLVLAASCAHGSGEVAKAPAPTGPVPPIEVRYERGRFRLGDDGAQTYVYEVEYRVNTAGGAEGWDEIEATWSPWRQKKPEIEATVETAAGETLELDPATAEVAELDPEGAERRLQIRAPLPGVGVGAVVTQRVVQEDLPQPLRPGSSGRFFFGMRVPVGLSELVLEVPVALPVAVEVRGADIEPEIEEAEGIRRIRYALRDLEPLGPVDKHLPSDAPRHPYVAFSTIPSWDAVAAPLAAAVDRSLRGAEVGSLLTGVPVEAAPAEVARAAVARARTLVRSTGRDFGQGPVVPMHPEETLARGEGDDEDVAALVLALLRARGLDAHLALVHEGPGEDLRPDLPGLEGFDRALVHVRGPAPLWIDPAAEYTPAGELPAELQGRWALVVDERAPALVRTPRADPIDNAYFEERLYELPDHGGARVVETTRAKGALGARLRAQIDGDEDPRPGIEAYVQNQYGRAKLGALELSDPRDLSGPVHVRLEALDADAARVDLIRGAVELRGAVLFGWLPSLVRDAALAPEGAPESREEELRMIAAALVGKRTAGFELPEPYVAELAFEVAPPAGFEISERPEDRVVELGPARYAATFALDAGRLKGRLRFDTGPSRYDADDLRALVSGLRDLFGTPLVELELVHRGTRLIQEGRIDEGIRELARISAAHPDSAPHRARLALGLLEVGLGDGARQVAREAVALEETSVVARYVLGHVLSHDRLGRPLAPGYDREGAMDALRLVKSLAPGHVRARAELAVLRSADERGLRFADPAGIEAAVAEYRSLREDTGINAFDDQLLEALLRGGRYEEVLLEASDMRRSLRRDAVVVAAVMALGQGSAGVDRVLRQLEIPEGAVALVEAAAATELAAIARYDEARAVLARVEARGDALGPLAERAERIEKIRAFESLLRPKGDPVRVVQEVLGHALVGESDPATLRPFVVARFSEADLAREAELLDRAFSGLARAAERSKVPAHVLRDGLLTATTYKVEEGPGGVFRVRALLEGRRPSWWFVREEQGSFRIAATGQHPGALGALAYEALEAGREAEAKQWLDWAEERLTAGPGSGAPEKDTEDGERFAELPFLALRSAGADLEAQALGLAALSRRAGPVLERLRARAAESEGELRDRFEHALVLGLAQAERWGELLPVLGRLLRRHPKSERLSSMRIGALVQLERWRQARRAVQAELRGRPNDPELLQQLANLETAQGRFAKAEAILERLAAAPDARSVVFNNLAWVSLFQREPKPRDLQRALKANALSRGQSPGELHTLAALHAARGDTQETVKLVRRRLELLEAAEPESMDYYLLGRVMEHLGLWRLAEQAYLRVEKDEGERADSTHALAQRRLRGLKKRSAI